MTSCRFWLQVARITGLISIIIITSRVRILQYIPQAAEYSDSSNHGNGIAGNGDSWIAG